MEDSSECPDEIHSDIAVFRKVRYNNCTFAVTFYVTANRYRQNHVTSKRVIPPIGHFCLPYMCQNYLSLHRCRQLQSCRVHNRTGCIRVIESTYDSPRLLSATTTVTQARQIAWLPL